MNKSLLFGNNFSNSFSNNMSNNLCNNCGKFGHAFNQCKQPITSLGIIAFRHGNPGIEYLLIRRCNSLGFIDFMRGKYPLYNKSYLMNVINEMTNYEKEQLKTEEFDTLWEGVWGKDVSVQYRGEEKISREKFISLKLGITINNNKYDLLSLIEESTTSWSEPEWGFPKGRRDYQEKDLQCAIREFEEETLYNKNQLKLVQNVLPYEEIFTGSNYKSYKHKYYLAYMDIVRENDINHAYKNSEISKLEWFSYDDACKIIRPYNLEKKNILEKVNKILTQYRLYS